MQQALYNTIHSSTSHLRSTGPRVSAATTAGVLALMGSSAAYDVFALSHLGL